MVLPIYHHLWENYSGTNAIEANDNCLTTNRRRAAPCRWKSGETSRLMPWRMMIIAGIVAGQIVSCVVFWEIVDSGKEQPATKETDSERTKRKEKRGAVLMNKVVTTWERGGSRMIARCCINVLFNDIIIRVVGSSYSASSCFIFYYAF